MPWCDECSRYWSPVSVRTATCPSCGREMEGVAQPEDIPKVPWHFTLLLVALGIYLAYRLWQAGLWLLHKV